MKTSLRSCYPSEYWSWKSARQRCQNTRDPDYHHYGGRGIEFRLGNFASFFAELGPRPSPEHSIDRVENNGHYEKGNVRWATVEEQRQNRRKYSIAHNNQSGVTGVFFDAPKNRWKAYGYKNRKNKSLGSFLTFEEAVSARRVWENA